MENFEHKNISSKHFEWKIFIVKGETSSIKITVNSFVIEYVYIMMTFAKKDLL